MNNIFKIRNVKYNFRNEFSFATRNVESVYHSSETTFYLGPKLRALLSKILKISKELTFSNQMLSFGSLRTVHAVCAKFI